MTTLRRSWLLHDLFAMTKRSVLYSIRNLDTLLTAIILPVAMMLLFVFVFGGAINVGEYDYVNYVTPAIILMCIGYCAATTSVSIQVDMGTGIINRFRSMGVSRTCVLGGQVAASVMRNVLSTVIVILVAVLIGFRPSAGLLECGLIVLLLLAYTITFTWAALLFGLIAKTAESASVFGFVALLLPYLSSAFVPIETMPYALQIFATHQPFTPITDALRSLSFGVVDKMALIISLVWIVCLGLVAYLASLSVYKHKKQG
ncbi:MAG: ABC transporter permease [Clostridiaceae bacterium]|jgi:ABC-2 type transport system permease protein|nr:ABC transporter permease [Clostridiaceae bacterium]